jgi:hypothetical protein
MVKPTPELHYREAAVSFFSALVDPEKRAQLGPTEAFCEWFDDFYAPADNPALYNPGVYERGLREWQSCFSTAELAAMAEFHAFFESIEEGFSVDRPYTEIEADPRWKGLIAAASKALNVFTPTI